MSSIQITVDTSQFDSMMSTFQDALANIGQGLKEAVDAVVMPDLLMLSQTLYNVQTGAYSMGWVDVQIDDSSVMIDNVGALYAQALETGWQHGSAFIEGRGVLAQALDETEEDLAGSVQNWLMSQVGS